MSPANSAADFGEIAVLVCEKDDIYFEQLREALGISNLFGRCVRAKDGVEALSKIRHQKFGLVVVDINLEKSDVLTLINRVRHTSASMDRKHRTSLLWLQ